MSKFVSATCEGGVVTADGVSVASVTILGEGVGPSSGVLVIDEDQLTYIPKTSPDLDGTLEKVIDALQAASDGLGSASSGLTALAPIADPIAGPLAIISAVAGLDSAQASIGTAKTALQELKGSLR